MRVQFLVLSLIFSLTAHADIHDCPNGCGTETDPLLEKVGQVLISTLQEIEFLKPNETYGSVTGSDWSLDWNVEKTEMDIVDDNFDEEEGDSPIVDFAVFYEFAWNRTSESDDEDDDSISLEDFSSADKVLIQIEKDIEFVHQHQKQDDEEIIHNLKNKSSPKLDAALTSARKHEQAWGQRLNACAHGRNAISHLYQDMLSWCIENHHWAGSIYTRGRLFFDRGEFIEAFDDISSFLSALGKKDREKFLNADVFFTQGKSASEIGMYNDAISALSQAIDKNPKYRDAYFERAAAYFETGNFDLALSDYLASNIKPQSFTEQAQDFLAFAAAIPLGIQQGSTQATMEFIPSLLSSAYGLSQALWAFAKDPVHVSVDFATAALECVQFFLEANLGETLDEVVPEMKELRATWPTLELPDRGLKFGQIVGKYSVEIFSSIALTKGVQAFQKLKKANNLLTFETLALSKRNKEAIAQEALKRSSARKQILKSSNLKIQMDKQGKHIVGHRNYDPGKTKSIFEHSDPQKLLEKFAGTGRKTVNLAPGTSGYVEVVNFQEFIGYAVDERSGKKTATTWGKIHYAKDGVHIVPTERK